MNTMPLVDVQHPESAQAPTPCFLATPTELPQAHQSKHFSQRVDEWFAYWRVRKSHSFKPEKMTWVKKLSRYRVLPSYIQARFIVYFLAIGQKIPLRDGVEGD
ncbi:MAG: hypothetical protein ABFS39_09380 [Pseudomonadota bacterium]